MAGKRLFVRKLDSRERTLLEALRNDPSAVRVGEKVIAVDMSAAGKSAPAIAKIVKRSPGTVRRWIRAFNAGGFEALGVSPHAQVEPVKIEKTVNLLGTISQRLHAAVEFAKPRVAHFGSAATKHAGAVYAVSSRSAMQWWARLMKRVLAVQAVFSSNA